MARQQWIVRRLITSLMVILGTTTITFFLIRLMPGNPVDYMRRQLLQQYGADLSSEEIDRLVQVYVNVSPSEPLWLQYINYVTSTFQGDLGHSWIHGRAVTVILAEVLPWTVFLLTIAITINYVIGILIGGAMAYFEGSSLDISLTGIFTTLVSIPFYVVAFILIFLLSYHWNVLPSGGRHSVHVTPGANLDFLINILYHAILPVASLVITGIGAVALNMRANSIQVLGSDFVKGARLRGLSSSRISYRYVARNAILPLYTGLLITLGFLFGGSVILEEVFQYRGAGLILYRAVLSRDYPLMMGTFLIITFAVVLGVLIADLTYGYLDPKADQMEEYQ